MMKFDELRQSLTEEQIQAIMIRLGADEIQDHGEYFTFRTICHNEHPYEAGFNLAYYKDSKLFHCFSECSQTFDIFELVRKRFIIDGEDSYPTSLYFFVLNYADSNLSSTIGRQEYQAIAHFYEQQPIEFILPEYSSNVLDVFVEYFAPEWLGDGISGPAQKKYGIKYHIKHNQIIIPHYDPTGRLVGIRGRSLDPEQAERYGKYRPIKIEETLYNHPLALNLYGLDKAKTAISETGVAIIAEGEKSCLQAENLLSKNVVVAACGNNISKWQVLLLLKYTDIKEIIVAFDREEQQGSNKYYNKLYTMCEKYKSYCNFSFIYDNQLMKLKESPFDQNKETLEKLIERRTRIK